MRSYSSLVLLILSATTTAMLLSVVVVVDVVSATSQLRATTSATSATELLEEDIDIEEPDVVLVSSLYYSWMDLHQKEYDNDLERQRRFEIWRKNHERIQAHNEQEPRPAYTLGHNQYSDWTQDEFARYFKLGKYSSSSSSAKKTIELEDDSSADDVDLEVDNDAELDVVTAKRDQEEWLLRGSKTSTTSRILYEPDDIVTLPDYVNWVHWGAVTPVKNQGACGACWAFSTTGALEGAHFLKTGTLTSLSEQNLLDCDHLDLGCQGGLMDNAFKFDEKSGGLCSEKDYPYKAEQGPVCKNCTDVPGSIVKTFVDVPPGSQKALLSAIAMQPISIAIEADQFVFQFYKSGIITDDACGKSGLIDHGVLAVGYGTDLETQQPYFLVKNSWGETWGDKGYVKIGRNTTNKFGICSILKLASFPIVE